MKRLRGVFTGEIKRRLMRQNRIAKTIVQLIRLGITCASFATTRDFLIDVTTYPLDVVNWFMGIAFLLV